MTDPQHSNGEPEYTRPDIPLNLGVDPRDLSGSLGNSNSSNSPEHEKMDEDRTKDSSADEENRTEEDEHSVDEQHARRSRFTVKTLQAGQFYVHHSDISGTPYYSAYDPRFDSEVNTLYEALSTRNGHIQVTEVSMSEYRDRASRRRARALAAELPQRRKARRFPARKQREADEQIILTPAKMKSKPRINGQLLRLATQALHWTEDRPAAHIILSSQSHLHPLDEVSLMRSLFYMHLTGENRELFMKMFPGRSPISCTPLPSLSLPLPYLFTSRTILERCVCK